MENMRLNKYLAKAGIAARRKADELIGNGRVLVNDKKPELGQKIDLENDIVKVNGKIVEIKSKKLYFLLNKPKKVLCAVSDKSDRKLVVELINTSERIFPVGRLDYETEGLIILTNDGEMFNKLIHPRKELYKVYIAKVAGNIKEEKIDNLANGIEIDGKKTLPAKVKILQIEKGKTDIEIAIREGRNRQIRKMLEEFDLRVINLKRIKIGEIDLGDLKLGEYRELTPEEINYIYKL